MPPEEVDKLIDEFEKWCGQNYGRRYEVAKALGVSRQYVTNVRFFPIENHPPKIPSFSTNSA
jgi:hypothetical protein